MSEHEKNFAAQLAELEKNGGIAQIEKWIKTSTPLWIKRSSGAWQEAVPMRFASNGLEVLMEWDNPDHAGDVLKKLVSSQDLLEWQKKKSMVE